MDKISLDLLQHKIGYKFKSADMLLLAITHSSYANEKKLEKQHCNERLEFLGDAVLDMVIGKRIFTTFTDMPEGEMTKLRAGIVCESSLAQKASLIELGEHLLLGKGEESTGGRGRESILADAFEAVIGSIYLDGGIEEAEKFILGLMLEDTMQMKENIQLLDSKTRLQEIIQKIGRNTVNYTIVEEKGPDHNKTFVSEVSNQDTIIGKGEGKSKKEAEQAAASDALKNMENKK